MALAGCMAISGGASGVFSKVSPVISKGIAGVIGIVAGASAVVHLVWGANLRGGRCDLLAVMQRILGEALYT